jgi:hypothetical protein
MFNVGHVRRRIFNVAQRRVKAVADAEAMVCLAYLDKALQVIRPSSDPGAPVEMILDLIKDEP